MEEAEEAVATMPQFNKIAPASTALWKV